MYFWVLRDPLIPLVQSQKQACLRITKANITLTW